MRGLEQPLLQVLLQARCIRLRRLAIHTGRAGSDSASAETLDTTLSPPPVFGRKELQAAQEKKRQLRERVIHGED